MPVQMSHGAGLQRTGIGLVPRRGTMSLAVGETCGRDDITEFPPTLKGSNIRPLRGRNLILGPAFRGFHPRLMIFFPFGEAETAQHPGYGLGIGRYATVNLHSLEAGWRRAQPCGSPNVVRRI